MRKKILFGAGVNGKTALDFFGESNVECFVDNSVDKIDTLYFGKKVISFEDLCKIYNDYEIVVTVNSFGEVAEQLKRAGITEFQRFMIPNVNRVLDYIGRIKNDTINSLAIWGTDVYAKSIYYSLPEDFRRLIHFCVQTSDENLFVDTENVDIISIDDKIPIVESVLIASPKYHLADELQIIRLCGNVKIYNPYRMDTYYSKKELVINKYAVEGNELKDEEKINEKNRNRYDYFEAVRRYVDEALVVKPLFHLIEIETINRCNGNCSFCPVNQKDDPREHRFMETELFYSIINQLEELSYDGRVSLFSNNEPFLDDRIFEFSKYAREHLPKAKIHMFTNGTLLTLDKFQMIIPYLDELIIDNYTENLNLIKPVEIIREYCEIHKELIEKVSIILRKPNELLTSRGGDAPNRKVTQTYPDITCAFPFQQMIVRPTGQISLCCNDAIGKYTMGDLSKDSIIDVWYGKQFTRVRELIAQGRKLVGNCQYCDTFSLYL